LWRWLATRFDVRRLVFVDESGTHISMDRLRSRAPRGQRAYGKVPKNRGKNLTLIASMSLQGMGESMCLEGGTDAKAFEAYVEHSLTPSLLEGQVVVMDNLGAHQPSRIRELIEARGAELVFVPSYSPDLNPIEQAFSKIKTILRKLGARTHEALLEAIAETLSKVTPADAVGWFNHCGYQVEVQYL
jgi:transposase